MKLRSILSLLIVALAVQPAVRAIAPLPANAAFSWEWEGAAYELTTTVGDDGQLYTRVEVEGCLNGAAPGRPSLPRLGKLVALPPSGDFGLEVIEVTYDTVRLDYPLEPAPLRFDAHSQPRPGGWTSAPDQSTYPADFVTLGDAAWMRDLRLARLTLTPVRYHPTRQTLDIVRHLRLRIWWEPATTSAPVVPASYSLDDVLAALVLNPADLDAFRSPHHFTNGPAERSLNRLTNSSHKILVATEGVYALDYPTLAAAGLPLENINPATLRLTHGDSEVAAQWEGDADTVFEDGERLLFYARPEPTRYAGHDVYWLDWGTTGGQLMAARSGDPSGLAPGTAWATVLAEENAAYDSLYPGRDGDRWFWRQLKLPDLVSDTTVISLGTPDATATGELTVWLQGFTRAAPDPDHHVRFSLNGSVIGDAWWEGTTAHTATLSLPAGLLNAGANTIGLSLPGDTGADVEGTWVDAIAITYGLSAVSADVARFRGQASASAYTIGGFSSDDLRIYDVTDAHAPQKVTGASIAGGVVNVGDAGSTPAEYLILTDGQIQAPLEIVAAKSFDDPSGGADYIIVTHPDFETALAPLAARRTAQGLRVVVVDVEALYDQFGDGRLDPAAIHAFLGHAYTNWPAPAPLYVLLVGDGTYDPRRYQPDSLPTYLPPYLADVDPDLGEINSDHQYADLSGDLLPEFRLGRFPVNTPAEAAAIVAKIISYETDPRPGGWNARLVFGADNPSSAGDHHADADGEFATYATPAYGYEGTRIYFSATGGAPHLYTNAQEAQNALITALNQGALLYTYFGHASWQQEAVLETDNYAPLFHLDHIARLSNRRRWPVVLHMTCLTGRYAHRADNTLDESLLRADGVGAVAVWGASGLGVASGHRILHRSFYQSVFDAGQAELGAATHTALASLYASGLYYDLIDTYHLFGDPALALNMTVVNLPFSVFLPIIAQGGN